MNCRNELIISLDEFTKSTSKYNFLMYQYNKLLHIIDPFFKLLKITIIKQKYKNIKTYEINYICQLFLIRDTRD